MKSTDTTPSAGGMQLLTVTLAGISPILMNPMTDEQLLALFDLAAYKAKPTKGMKPAEVAAMRLYRDSEGWIGIPGLNLFAAIIGAGVYFADPTSKGGKSKLSTAQKSIIPSLLALHIDSQFCRFENISKPFNPETDTDLDGKNMPFVVDIRRGVNATTGGATAIIRPRIDNWNFTVKFEFDGGQINEVLLRELITAAGSRCGLGDFRPNKRGVFGRFQITGWKVEEMETTIKAVA